MGSVPLSVFFFLQAEDGIRDGHVTGVQTCALPIYDVTAKQMLLGMMTLMSAAMQNLAATHPKMAAHMQSNGPKTEDRKSTRLNSSHVASSYAVFCLKKKIIQMDRSSVWKRHIPSLK